MATKGKSLVTDLIGQEIAPLYPTNVGNYHGAWPINDPNLSGEHTAFIRAAWVADDSHVKLLAYTPKSGFMFETYASNVKLVRR